MHLLVLTDDKKGHENQSLGLAEALLRRRAGSYEISSISNLDSKITKQPSAVIGAGHGTHPFLLRLARHYRCPSIVIMKPSLPSFLFSQCLIPEHDFKTGKKCRPNVITTKGALNRLPEDYPEKQAKGLILLGGPSKHFHWQEQALANAISSLVQADSPLTWTIGDSRRTPEGTLERISPLVPGDVTLAHHQQTTGSWLVDRLLESQVAWITPDSTSMLFEALTAGCRLGTLPLEPRNTRLSQAHQQLAEQGWLTPFQSCNSTENIPMPPHHLHETGRCADLLIERLFS